jgi:hypothetical protein
MTTGSLELGHFAAPVERRGTLVVAAWIAAALALTLVCPGVPFVLAPAVFGVLHVAADYRYLMARRRLPRGLFVGILASAAALVSLRGLEAAVPAGLWFARLEVAIGFGTAVAAMALGSRGRPLARRLAFVLPLALAGAAAVTSPLTARLGFAHAHNVVGVLLFLFLFRGRGERRSAVVFLVAFAAAVALVLGAPAPLTSVAPAWGARMLADTSAALPAALRAELGWGLGLSYVFLQLVHYGVWLAFVPMADGVPGRGVLEGFRELGRELGPVVLGGTALLAVAVLGASFIEVHRTRQIYLSVATFHGYLELAAGGYLLARGGLARTAAR